jgi:hypothetical protein
MERCKDLITVTFYFIVAMLIFSCGSTAPSATAEGPQQKKDGLVEAMVLDYHELDGCTFILSLDDGTKLEPTNLPESFRKDSLKVMVKYSIIKRASICMVGKMVTVSEIKTCTEE